MGWRRDDQRPAVSSGSGSILKPTAASGFITLRTPVTKPHTMEQRPLPDSTNYTDPLRVSAASTDGRTEVRSFARSVKEETNATVGNFFASSLTGQDQTFFEEKKEKFLE